MNWFLKSVLAFIGVIFSTNPISIEASTLQTVPISEREGKVMNYEKLKIKSFKYWGLYLHENQCYLGRTFVQLKDESRMEDFMDIKREVRENFFKSASS